MHVGQFVFCVFCFFLEMQSFLVFRRTKIGKGIPSAKSLQGGSNPKLWVVIVLLFCLFIYCVGILVL